MAASPTQESDRSFEDEVELGGTGDLDAFLAARGEALDKNLDDSSISPSASRNVDKGSPLSVTSDDIERRLNQLQSLLGDDNDEGESAKDHAALATFDQIDTDHNGTIDKKEFLDAVHSAQVNVGESGSADLNSRLERVETLLTTATGEANEDDGGGNKDYKLPKPKPGTQLQDSRVKNKPLNLKDFGSPVLASSRLAISSAVLSSAPADEELENRLARLSKLLDDGDRSKLSMPSAETYISGAELGRGLLERTSSTPEWHTLNAMLREYGFAGFQQTTAADGSTMPDSASLRQTIRELLNQWERRGEVVQELMLQNAGQGGHRGGDADVKKTLAKFRARDEASQRALVASEARLADAQESLAKLKHKESKVSAKYSVETVGLKQQLTQSEHRVKAKEHVISRLQDRLQAESKRHEMEMKRARDIFKRFSNREARPSSAVDTKTLEIVRMYETQRDGLVRELEHLRREVALLNVDVKDRDNLIHRKDFASSLKHAPEASALMQRLEQDKVALKLRVEAVESREADIAEKLAKAEHRVARAELYSQTKDEENTNLRLELQSRPTMKAHKMLQKEVEKLRLALDAPGAENEARQNWKRTDTRSSIKRDRDNARLNLTGLETQLSHAKAIDLLQNTCRELNLRDPVLIAPTLEKINKVMRAVPAMQSFTTKVCGILCPEKAGRARGFPASERMKMALNSLESMGLRHDGANASNSANSNPTNPAAMVLPAENLSVISNERMQVVDGPTIDAPNKRSGGEAWSIPPPVSKSGKNKPPSWA
jgi:hypothetical protein